MSLRTQRQQSEQRHRKPAGAGGAQGLSGAAIGGAKQIGEDLADRRAVKNGEREHARGRSDAHHHDAEDGQR